MLHKEYRAIYILIYRHLIRLNDFHEHETKNDFREHCKLVYKNNRWHLHHHLSSSISNFWFIHEGSLDSWNWRSLLRLRPLAERFIRCSIGNGLTASFWGDSWTPMGPLIKFLGEEGPRILRIPISSKVASTVNGTVWKLPPPRSNKALDLHYASAPAAFS